MLQSPTSSSATSSRISRDLFDDDLEDDEEGHPVFYEEPVVTSSRSILHGTSYTPGKSGLDASGEETTIAETEPSTPDDGEESDAFGDTDTNTEPPEPREDLYNLYPAMNNDDDDDDDDDNGILPLPHSVTQKDLVHEHHPDYEMYEDREPLVPVPFFLLPFLPSLDQDDTLINFVRHDQEPGEKPAFTTQGAAMKELHPTNWIRYWCLTFLLLLIGAGIAIGVTLSVLGYSDFANDESVWQAMSGSGPETTDSYGAPKEALDGIDNRAVGTKDALSLAIDLAGAATCRLVPEPLSWPSGGFTAVLGDTARTGATTPGTNFCNIHNGSPGLWYSLRGTDARFYITVFGNVPGDDGEGDRTVNGTSGDFPFLNIQLSVVRGTCGAEGQFSSSLQCITTRISRDDGQAKTTVEFFGDKDVLYYIYVQGVTSADAGPFGMVVQRGWNLAAQLAGTTVNGSLGVSVAISGDGSLVAAGAAFADHPMYGQRHGHVRFFQRNQKFEYVEAETAVLLGPQNQSLTGFNVDLSEDGKTLAVLHSDALSIHAQQPNGQGLLSWKQVFLVETENWDTHAPGSVAMSADGSTVAWNIHVPDEERGFVEVFVRVTDVSGGESWKRKGAALMLGTFATGNVYDKAVALSADGNSLVMAGPDNTARLYVWQSAAGTSSPLAGIWTLRHNHVIKHVTSVALTANGNCVAAGRGGNANTRVRVWCYRTNPEGGEDAVIQVGQTLVGHSTNFGHSLSFSRGGTILAVGAPWYDVTSTRRDSGRVFLYEYNSVQQVWDPKGRLETAVESNLFGWSVDVAYDALALVVGVPWNKANGLERSGLVQVANVYL